MFSIAVVPIVFNAGAAVLPAVLAGLVSVAAMLVRPSQWGRICRERPWIPAILVVALASGVFAWQFWPSSPATAPRRTIVAGGNTDWTAVALAYLRENESLPPRDADPLPPTTPHDLIDSPVISRANPQRTGYAGGPSPASLRPVWNFIDPDDDLAQYLGSVAVHGSSVYAASATLTPPTSAGALVCLDAATGRKRWVTYEAPAFNGGGAAAFKGIFSSPAVTADGRYVIVGEGLHADRDSALMGFDAHTGTLRWRVVTPLHIESSPAIEGDIAVVGAGAVEVGTHHKPAAGDDPGFVMGVRISDGQLLWKHPVNDPESSPAIADGIAYIGSGVNGHAVVALRIDDDQTLAQQGLTREVWRTNTDYPAVGSVTLIDDLVLIGCGRGDFVFADPHPIGVVLALDRRSGAVRWQVALPDTVLASIAAHDGVAFAPCRNGELIAINLTDQSIRWRTRISGNSPLMAGPAVTDTHVYVVSNDGYLAVLDRHNGTLLEKHYVNRPGRPGELGLSISGPIVAHGRVYVGSETGGVHAFEGSDP